VARRVLPGRHLRGREQRNSFERRIPRARGDLELRSCTPLRSLRGSMLGDDNRSRFNGLGRRRVLPVSVLQGDRRVDVQVVVRDHAADP
jgi:hypothetical protein